MPNPKTLPINLSYSQQVLLKQLVRRSTNPHRLVRRAQLVLAAAAGKSNTQISQQLELDRGQVRLWRNRWLDASVELAAAEMEAVSHWTATELAQEAMKRSIVEKISPRSVGRFLKRSHFTTASSSLLVKCQSR
jgi:transposase